MSSIAKLCVVAPIYPALLLLLSGTVVLFYYHGPDRRLDRFMVGLSALLPCNIMSRGGAMAVGYLRPAKLDLYGSRMDAFLGFQPSFTLGRLIGDNAALIILLKKSYELLPVAILAVFGGYLCHQSDRQAMEMVPIFVLNVVLVVPFYLMCPVSGPLYAFPGFPALPNGPVVPHPIPLNAPQN